MLKACLNGGRSPGAHPALPITPADLALDARLVAVAGAAAVHLHPRGADGRESLRAADIAAAVAAVRDAVGRVPVGVSTGIWITGDPDARLAQVRGWRDVARPDFVSVNLAEPGADRLIDALVEAGVGVEAGVWSVADAARAAVLRPATGWTRVLVEIIDVPAGSTAGDHADAILAALDAAGVTGPRLLHGEGGHCWEMVDHAARLGLDTRIGLEDTLVGPDGEAVAGNAELVRLALARRAAAR